jgi:tetratricopeptide (TPR) repeat protein
VLVLLLENGGYFTQPKAYLVVPYWAHFYRARALLGAGRLDEARRHIARCQAIMPGDVDLAIYLMPELEKHGLKKEAEELFRQSEAHYTRLCTDYPKSPAWHNTLAWLDARCHRELDRALAHAKEAARLDPKNAGLLDTLAEVHFQRGDRARAVALMKRCIELDPGKEYFRKQLARFETGNPRADVPAESAGE